jgi:hypothetical protein
MKAFPTLFLLTDWACTLLLGSQCHRLCNFPLQSNSFLNLHSAVLQMEWSSSANNMVWTAAIPQTWHKLRLENVYYSCKRLPCHLLMQEQSVMYMAYSSQLACKCKQPVTHTAYCSSHFIEVMDIAQNVSGFAGALASMAKKVWIQVNLPVMYWTRYKMKCSSTFAKRHSALTNTKNLSGFYSAIGLYRLSEHRGRWSSADFLG